MPLEYVEGQVWIMFEESNGWVHIQYNLDCLLLFI